jgi:hypothetical protein
LRDVVAKAEVLDFVLLSLGAFKQPVGGLESDQIGDLRQIRLCGSGSLLQAGCVVVGQKQEAIDAARSIGRLPVMEGKIPVRRIVHPSLERVSAQFRGGYNSVRQS